MSSPEHLERVLARGVARDLREARIVSAAIWVPTIALAIGVAVLGDPDVLCGPVGAGLCVAALVALGVARLVYDSRRGKHDLGAAIARIAEVRDWAISTPTGPALWLRFGPPRAYLQVFPIADWLDREEVEALMQELAPHAVWVDAPM